MAEPQSHKVVALLTNRIQDLEKRYQEELKAGAEFEVLKSIRVEIHRLKEKEAQCQQAGADHSKLACA